MLNYEAFCAVITGRIKDHLPEEFRDHEPTIRAVRKINGEKDGFCLEPPEQEEFVPLPVLYLDDVYQDYLTDEDIDRVLECMAEVITANTGRQLPDELKGDYSAFRDCVVVNLISGQLNERLLDEVPHRKILDMAAVYRVIFRWDEAGVNSFIVSNEMMEDMGVTEEELFDLARTNSRRMFPARVIEGKDSVVVMTNESGMNGASTMLYEREMRDLSRRMGGDFYILPSSVHEFFAVPVHAASPEYLKKLLEQGNGTVTDYQEILSSSIYRYSEERGTLKQCD